MIWWFQIFKNVFLFQFQKEMFSQKVDGIGGGGGNLSVANSSHPEMTAPNQTPIGGSMRSEPRERKMSGGSGSAGGSAPVAPAGTGMKSKWMKAFKGVKKDKEPSEER